MAVAACSLMRTPISSLSIVVAMAYPRLRSLEVLLVSSLGHEIEAVVARIHHINAARKAGIGVEQIAVRGLVAHLNINGNPLQPSRCFGFALLSPPFTS